MPRLTRWLGPCLLLLLLLSLIMATGCGKEEAGPAGPAIPDATVTGKVKNAQTGSTVAGARVVADDGNFATSAANGQFQLDLSSGDRVITVSAADFDTVRKNIHITAGDLIQNVNFNLSPVLSGDQALRIVLSWDATPEDLDAHLLTPAVEGRVYHVYWNNEGAAVAAPYAVLDVDAREGYGPETITVHDLKPGTYHYWVHRYSEDVALAGCGALVEVYSRQGLIRRFTTPESGADDYWHVFDIDGSTGNLEPVDRIVGEPPGVDRSSYITMLTWDEQPSDLDAHLLTPIIEGEKYDVYSEFMGDSDRPPYATLLEDVTEGWGPEIITIHRFCPGTYTYFVDNYSREVALTGSGALVSIWDGNGIFLLGWTGVPASGEGRYWHAFTIDGTSGAMTGIGELSDAPPGAVVSELIYDDGDPEDYRRVNPDYLPGAFAVRMNPSAPGEILSLKYMTYVTGDNRSFNAQVYSWTGSQPGANPVYSRQATAVHQDWVEVDMTDLGITFSAVFVVAFGQTSPDTWLGYDTYNNGRGWVIASGYTWGSWDETLFIRAVVMYRDGTVSELGPSVAPQLLSRQCPPSPDGRLPSKATTSLR